MAKRKRIPDPVSYWIGHKSYSISKAAHDFLQFIDVRPLKEKITPDRPKEGNVTVLERLCVFDEAT